MSCIPKILELQGDKDHLHIMDHSKLPADCGVVIEGGGEYKGYPYLITFTGTAHRCGYVAIDEGHPLYGKDLMQNSAPEPFDLCVHGGITFHEKGTHVLERLFPDQPHCNDEWIGFDAAHAWDGKDWEKHAKYFGEEKMKKLSSYFTFFDRDETIRTYSYIEQQCKNLIDQIIEGMKAA